MYFYELFLRIYVLHNSIVYHYITLDISAVRSLLLMLLFDSDFKSCMFSVAFLDSGAYFCHSGVKHGQQAEQVLG